MAQKITIFRGSTGLNNKIDPARLKFDPDTGVQDFSECVNVDIDLTGRPGRRKGYVQLRSDDSHSVWSNGELCFYVSGESLYRLNSDWSRTGIRSGLVLDARMSFCDFGGSVYYSNGFQNGRIADGISYAWAGDPYFGPEIIWKVETAPPVGNLLASAGGYMLVAWDKYLSVSMQFAPAWYRSSKDLFEFDSKITMVKPLEDGVWISDEKNTYWLEGLDPEKWKRIKKAPYPAIMGTVVEVEPEKVGLQLPDNCAVWTSPKGICVGAAQGFFANLTEKKLRHPTAPHGAALLIDDLYVCALSTHRMAIADRLPVGAISQYMDFNFNSFCTFNGIPIASRNDGIFQLDSGGSDNSNPISAWFKLVTTDLGTDNFKRVRRVSIGYEADGDLALSVFADEKILDTYPVVPSEDDGTQQGNSVYVSRDVYGRHWSFKIENVNGADFSVDHLSIIPVVLSRQK